MKVSVPSESSLPCLRPALAWAAACTVLFALLLQAGLHRGWVDEAGVVTAACAYLMSLVLIGRGLRGHRGRDGRVHRAFGAANAVTSLRLVLVCWLLAWCAAHAFTSPGWVLLAVTVFAAALDAVDGPLARASGLDSAFGARFDMETDALLVLVLSVLVWRAGIAGPWVLLSGLLRYGFVALAWWLPWLARPLEPSFRRKVVCVLQIAALVVALLPGLAPDVAAGIALFGLLLLIASFAMDVAWLAARHRAGTPGVSPWPDSPGSPWRAALQAVLVWGVLNAALTFENVWPTPMVVPAAALSPEILALVGGLAVWAVAGRRLGPRGRRLIAWILLLLIVGRYLQVTSSSLFGRPFNFYWDGRHLPQVLLLAAAEQPPLRVAAIALGAVAALGVSVWLMIRIWAWGIARLFDAFVVKAVARSVAGLALALLLVWGADRLSGSPKLWRVFSHPVSVGYLEQGWFLAQALAPGAVERLLPPSPAFAGDLDALAGADVLVLFLESYGAVTRDDPAMAAALMPARERLAQAATRSGLGVVSAFVRSPTFGGGSWLAHASLLSGLAMDDPAHYHLLLTTDRPTLVSHFAAHGYETVGWMPGLHKDWPEGAFYGYDRIVDADALEYPGPLFGFWRIPDQYSIARLSALELHGGPRRPRFIVFPTITSHVPFRPLPPYVSDRSRLLSGDAFDANEVSKALAVRADWSNLTPAYTAGVDYSLRWLADFLTDQADRAGRPLVIVALGDHQPTGSITGPAASWDVPVHVFARDARLLGRLERAGFTRGLDAPRAPLGHMAALATTLSAVFAKAGVDVPGTAGASGVGREPGAQFTGVPPAGNPEAQRLAR